MRTQRLNQSEHSGSCVFYLFGVSAVRVPNAEGFRGVMTDATESSEEKYVALRPLDEALAGSRRLRIKNSGGYTLSRRAVL